MKNEYGLLPDNWAKDLEINNEIVDKEIVEKHNLTDESTELIKHYKKEREEQLMEHGKLPDRTISDDINDYYKTEERIRKYIQNLENWGKKCNCNNDNDNTMLLITGDVGEYYVNKYCLDCGGYVDE